MLSLHARQRALLEKAGGHIVFDNLTRQLYATDASVYQVEPAAVAFPRGAGEAAAVIRAAAEAEVPVIPRGAGSGLVGGALGEGLIIEFSRFNREIASLDLEKRTVRAGAGVVLDQLNAFLKPRGYCFGPDVATSSRATIGGMIANNSSGAHVPVYGCTADHVHSLEIVRADGQLDTLDHRPRPALAELVRAAASEIEARMPATLLKRWPGYGVDRFARDANASHLLAGSEGTLAAIISAELKIVPIPRQKTLALIFFASVAEAMRATVELLDLAPAAIEHIDRVLFDQTRGQLAFRAARDLLELDQKPCESILLVEFFDDDGARLESVGAKKLGLRTLLLRDSALMGLVWNMRKAGLSLLTGCKGGAKPVTAIEDAAVDPRRLPEYVDGLMRILGARGLEACFYGHAASGLLHVRPVLDLHDADDLRKFREVSDETAALVRQFGGSLAGEHGVGIARTEYMEGQMGPPLLDLMRGIKNSFDPKDLFNPGKIIPDGRWKLDARLRMGADHRLELPFPPRLAFAAKDESFVANLEQCNGCGGCRKAAPTMCPTFVATGDEIMSTRGRANIIRAALEGRGIEGPLALGGVGGRFGQLPFVQSLHRRMPIQRQSRPAQGRTAAWPPSKIWTKRARAPFQRGRSARPGRMHGSAPFNWFLQFAPLRRLMQKFLGIAARRPLPPYARERFDRWHLRHQPKTSGARGEVVLWDDTFVRYHEAHIGQAAVAVLEAAGYSVKLALGRKCCGRPAFSQGCLDRAAALGRHNLRLLTEFAPSAPILFLEPSCYSMFVEDYAELRIPGAAEIKSRCHLFEEFVDNLLAREPQAIAFQPKAETVAIHAHCHAKSLLNPSFMKRLAARLPGRTATLLETGCCGMAGAFGALESKYDLSVKVAQPLLSQVAAQPEAAVIVACGASCRHQLEHLSARHPCHMAELLAAALKD